MELYNANDMPLSNDEIKRNAQLKYINNEELNLREKMLLGRDHTIKEYSDFKFKPDHVYRAIDEKLLQIYKKTGYISGFGDNDEYIEYEENGKKYSNNAGVDWYLGGASLRYGDIIIECPADKSYFKPASDNGNCLSIDPTVKHMKSSGSENPVPISMITNAFKVSQKFKQQEIIEIFQILREQNMNEYVSDRLNSIEIKKQETLELINRGFSK